MELRILLVLLVGLSHFSVVQGQTSSGGKEPTILSAFADEEVVSSALADYKQAGFDWRKIIRPGAYVRSGNYLNWSVWSTDPASWVGVTQLDTNGVIMVTYDGKTYYYNPTTICLHALYLHSLYTRGAALDPHFKLAADFLVQMQAADGSLRYDFAFWPFTPGWVSGQAQGHALSVWTRAYKLFGDSKYLDACRKSFEFMMRDVADGGCLDSLADIDPALSDYRILTELPFRPYQYALDGSLFPIFGIYDWSEFDPSAMEAFNRLVEAIKVALPYYDLGGISAYDLQYIVGGMDPVIYPAYHGMNTGMLWLLDSICHDPVLEDTWKRWAYYVGQPGPAPMNFQINPIEGGRATVSFGVDEPILLDRVDALDRQSWEPLPVLAGQDASLEVDMTSASGFFRATRGFPIIDGGTLNGGLEIWDNAEAPAAWVAISYGGILHQDDSDVHGGDYSCRIDTFSSELAGLYRGGVFLPERSYFLDFWAKATGPARLAVYFGVDSDPAEIFDLDSNWTRYTVYGQADYTGTLGIYSKTGGVSVYVDDVRLFEFGPP